MLDPRLTVWTSQRGLKQPTLGNGLICFHAKFDELPLGLRVKLQPGARYLKPVFPTITVSGGKRSCAALKLSVVFQVACSLKAAKL